MTLPTLPPQMPAGTTRAEGLTQLRQQAINARTDVFGVRWHAASLFGRDHGITVKMRRAESLLCAAIDDLVKFGDKP